MPTIDAIRWFKKEFESQVEAAVRGSPMSVDLLTAIACQETGYIWNPLRKKLDRSEVLALCVGDVIDAPGRKAFPRSKAELLAHPQGPQMYSLGRQALQDIAAHIASYQPYAAKPSKFCRGYGIFQYDLQYFKADPEYFLSKRYADFDESLAKAVQELKAKLKRLGWQHKQTLTEYESAALAIAYNTGSFNPSRGMQQGHQSGGRYYGEFIADYLRLSRQVGSVLNPGALPGLSVNVPPAPEPLTASGASYIVSSLISVLNVRSEPLIPTEKPSRNVIATLPEGQVVKALSERKQNGFLAIETSLNGALIRGFCAVKYLSRAPAPVDVPILEPSAGPVSKGITAVYMPRRPGTLTQRVDKANAHTIHERRMPTRTAITPAERREQLSAIVDWLDVGNSAHARYWPRAGLTFCNIYAHDYCFLAGCYLPRVWWNARAVAALSSGKTLEPLYGNTIDEQRANDLFRWLRDFGLSFGWRQSASLDELQQEANAGSLGLIVARRREDGRSGHIVAVIAESDGLRARRNTEGRVTAPVQSQAGAKNFARGTGRLDWFRGEEFAEFAFWIHA